MVYEAVFYLLNKNLMNGAFLIFRAHHNLGENLLGYNMEKVLVN